MNPTFERTSEHENEFKLKLKNWQELQIKPDPDGPNLNNNNNNHHSTTANGTENLNSDNNLQHWTRQSFINMYLQTKYLEIFAKNQTYMNCIKQLTTTCNDGSDEKSLSPPQEIPLDLSKKADDTAATTTHSSMFGFDIARELGYNGSIVMDRNSNALTEIPKQEPMINNVINKIPPPHTALQFQRHNLITTSPLQINGGAIGAVGKLEPPDGGGALKTFSCFVCSQSFDLQDRLAKHIASCHKQKKKQNETGKSYECEVCRRSFARSDMLTRHSRLHTGEWRIL